MIPDWAPNIHPLVVHFPIALLLAAVVTDLLSVVLTRRPALREAATWLYCAGAGTAVAAYLTGSSAADSMLLPAEVTPLVDVHDNWAFRTTALFALLAAARLALPRFLTLKAPAWWGALALALVGAGMLYETAERGGQLVFQHGLGVQAITTDAPVAELLPEPTAGQVDPGPIDLGDGSWVWRPVQGADAVLAEQFTWIENRPEGLPAEMVEDAEKGSVLRLSAAGPAALAVAGGAVDSAQADVYVNVDDLDGELQILLHAQDAENYDYFAFDGQTAALGRMEGGAATVFEEQAVDASGWLFLRVFGGDGHFRGYVNGDLVAHGHDDDLPPGPFGLKVSGSGVVLLERIQVQAVSD